MSTIDYKIVIGKDANELEKIVKELIQTGWQPKGGLATVVTSTFIPEEWVPNGPYDSAGHRRPASTYHGIHWYQAMVRKSNDYQP